MLWWLIYLECGKCVCVWLGIDASRALQLLTHPGPYALPSLENVVSRATSNLVHRPDEAAISDDQLNAILLVYICHAVLINSLMLSDIQDNMLIKVEVLKKWTNRQVTMQLVLERSSLLS